MCAEPRGGSCWALKTGAEREMAACGGEKGVHLPYLVQTWARVPGGNSEKAERQRP